VLIMFEQNPRNVRRFEADYFNPHHHLAFTSRLSLPSTVDGFPMNRLGRLPGQGWSVPEI